MQPRIGIGPSLLLHALAVLGLSQAVPGPVQIAADPIATIALAILPPRRPPESVMQPEPPPPPDETQRQASPPDEIQRVAPARDEEHGQPAPEAPPANRRLPRATIRRAPPALAVAPPAPAPETSRPIDWTQARRRAAAEVVAEQERTSSVQSFAFPGLIAERRAADDDERFDQTERGLRAPLTAFDSPSKGRAGLASRTVLGSLAWISDDCYRVADTSGRARLQGSPVPATLCTRREPRDDLFATAKPSYLMDAEERAAAAAADERRDRLRRQTTGEVMSFEQDRPGSAECPPFRGSRSANTITYARPRRT